jgi:RHS repeat-associated protein
MNIRGHVILSCVLWHLIMLPGLAVTTTVFVNKSFELRDHDQPTKFVFNGATRVAAITGSLSNNPRIQRLRLYPGWNLISLAVAATNVLEQLNSPNAPITTSAYRWNEQGRNYSEITAGQVLPAGAVLWVRAMTNRVASISGHYRDATNRVIPAGGAYISGPGLESWTLDESIPSSASRWIHDAEFWQWSARLTGDLQFISEPPRIVGPGQAIYVNTDTPAKLHVPDPTVRIRYFHPDHLGSSAAMTDSQGALIEETAFYPFGHPRNDYQPRQIREPYQFTDKERDIESGLHYFGKRFYYSTIGKWLSTDPLEEKGGGLNLYAYVNQNPLKYHDPDGAEVKVTKSQKNGATAYQIDVKAVVVDVSGRSFSQKELQDYADILKAQIEKSYSGKEGKVSWKAVVDLRVIDDPAKAAKNDHIFRIVDHTKSRSAGAAYIGGITMDIAAHTLRDPRPGRDKIDETNPLNKKYAQFYQSPETVGAHELGHVLGLDHVTSDNLMHGGVREHDTSTITRQQIEETYKQYQAQKLNIPDEELARKGSGALQ